MRTVNSRTIAQWVGRLQRLQPLSHLVAVTLVAPPKGEPVPRLGVTPRTIRRWVAQLQELSPLRWPVHVDLAPRKRCTLLGEAFWDHKQHRHMIWVRASQSRAVIKDTLLHEWVHCAMYDVHASRWYGHQDEFWVRYARLVEAFNVSRLSRSSPHGIHVRRDQPRGTVKDCVLYEWAVHARAPDEHLDALWMRYGRLYRKWY